MARQNKAHTATLRRIAVRYGATINDGEGFDIQAEGITIEVETSASIGRAIKRLLVRPGPVYVAVTNKETVSLAIRLTRGTRVGVMDPYGEIVKQSADDFPPPPEPAEL
jgi:hypothetical protein